MNVRKVLLPDDNFELSKIISGVWRLWSWNMSNEEVLRFIKECVELGITSFDNADIYGNYSCETIFGNALSLDPAIRNQIQLITKCDIKLKSEKYPERWFRTYDTSKEHIIFSVENSLKNLQTDRIDLLLIHRPDPLMNADEVSEAFYTLRSSGKVLHFGVSNFLPHHFELLQSRLDFNLVTNQIEFSPSFVAPMFDGTLDQAQQLRCPPMIWSPFAGGRLFTEQTEQFIKIRNALQKTADELGNYSITQIALAWILSHPSNPLPVLGTGKIDRIKESIQSIEIELSREYWFYILKESMGYELP